MAGADDDMTLDIHALLVLMLANVFALGAAMPVVMGWRVSASGATGGSAPARP